MLYWQHSDPYKQGHPSKHTMNPERLQRVKDVFTVPSHTRQEQQISQYIQDFCTTHGFEFVVDEIHNVLITKGMVGENEYYPMVGAHTDTVHTLENKTIKEDRGILTAFNDNGIQVGIGGDDLSGVAICLELLLILPVLKVGLFVSEECGCIGSKYVATHNPDWFKDVGYMIEFDGPEDYMITQFCSGVELFESSGDFIQKTMPLLKESMGAKIKFFSHPYTDVSIIKEEFNFSCINVSAGYFNYHTSSEYVVIEEMEKAIKLGLKMIAELGFNHYFFKATSRYKTWYYKPTTQFTHHSSSATTRYFPRFEDDDFLSD